VAKCLHSGFILHRTVFAAAIEPCSVSDASELLVRELDRRGVGESGGEADLGAESPPGRGWSRRHAGSSSSSFPFTHRRRSGAPGSRRASQRVRPPERRLAGQGRLRRSRSTSRRGSVPGTPSGGRRLVRRWGRGPGLRRVGPGAPWLHQWPTSPVVPAGAFLGPVARPGRQGRARRASDRFRRTVPPDHPVAARTRAGIRGTHPVARIRASRVGCLNWRPK
jgi:hypothetical protein